jgi:Bacterial pre-peptidase C-terminal domain
MRVMLRLALSVLSPFFLACFVLFSSQNVFAIQPTLSSFKPVGMQRGIVTEWTLTGTRLADVQEILFYEPGLKVEELKAVDATKITAKINIAADCPLGIKAFRIRTATGITGLRTITVGPFADLEEKEPNNDFTQPQLVQKNNTITGVVAPEDVDYFVLEANKGERISVEMEGLRLGNILFDPYVAILNEARFELARSDDSPLLHQDCLVSLLAPETGRYIIQVRESSYGGNGAANYRLHVGNFPRPSAVYPAGGRPGENLQVKLLGDAAGEFQQSVVLPSDGTRLFGFYPQDSMGAAPSANMLRVVDLPNVLEAEPNAAIEQVTTAAAPAPVALNGIIQIAEDVDMFKISAKKGEQFDVRVVARKDLRSPLDSVLTILNAKGSAVANNDDQGGPDSYLRFSVPADGEYFVSVRDHLKNGGPTYVYRVEIEPVKPQITLALPERVQYIATTLTIPKNNRMAVMVNAQRANFSGAVKIETPNLPSGLTAQAVPYAADRVETPVLFTASAEVSPLGLLVDLVAKPEDAAIAVEGHLAQRAMLIRGQNNNEFWGYSSNRMATVVAEEIPFQIELVQPQAPLPKNGSLTLKVVAKRKEGFNAAINVRLLYNPQGTSSSTSIVIPENQNEVVIPITAGGNALPGNWKIVAVATAPHEGATVECASQLIDLNIADQFYAFTFERTAVEVGQATELTVKIEKKTDFVGEATAELLGLPVGVTAETLKFNKDTSEIVFSIKAEPTAKVGKTTGIVCRTVFQMQGDSVTQTLSGTDLRIDQPLPPKVAAPPAKKPEAPAANPAEPKKRLSRLEQLRQEQEAAAKSK